ncbi:MAG: prepilin-type N-terminal cleavage/methylation domain-containing protein [Nitrospinota bacterium]
MDGLPKLRRAKPKRFERLGRIDFGQATDEKVDEKVPDGLFQQLVSKKDGFTLVEITVVMLIIGIFAIITLPKLSDLAGLRIEKDARKLAHTITYLYAQAAAHGTIVRLYFDLETGEYFPAMLNQDNKFERTSFALFSGGRLDGRTRIKRFETAFSGTFTGDTAYIHFMPEGFAEKAVITIEDGKRGSFTLIVHPLTGRVNIVKGPLKKGNTGLAARAA